LNAPADINHNQQIAEHYDNTPYLSNPFYYSSPRHLRATAHLYGVDTVPLDQARVLELGCAAGGNLLPFALAYPHGTAVGVDLSPVQIEQGQRILKDLGVGNMTLHAMSLTDITPDFGQFDYIVVHGVFSWVPAEVKQAILRICRENLAPQGIAYVSYNTYPGWKSNDIVRDAMLLHSHGAQSDEERLARAKSMLNLLSRGLSPRNPLAESLRGAVEHLQNQSDYYLTHEYLEAFNHPCYLVEFVDAAQHAGLEYVGDAEAQGELAWTYGRAVQVHHSTTAMGQPKAIRQQYLDFAVGRMFRKSLLTHPENAVSLRMDPDLEHLADLRFAGTYVREPAYESNLPAGHRTYRNNRGRRLRSPDAAMFVLVDVLNAAWPRSLPFDDLVRQAEARLKAAGEDADRAKIQKAVRILYASATCYVSLDPMPYDAVPEGPPQVTRGYAYLAARQQGKGCGVGALNLWHDGANIRLREAGEWLVPYLDGSRSSAQLRSLLRDALQKGKILDLEGKSLAGRRNLDPHAQKILDKLLHALKFAGVLLRG